MGRNSVPQSKGSISIVLSICSSISTSSESFCWRFSISFFYVGSFTQIDTYVVCVFYFFFYGGVNILANTTSGSVPVFITVSNDIPSLPLPFFGHLVSGIPTDLRFSAPWLVSHVLFSIHSLSFFRSLPSLFDELCSSLLIFLSFLECMVSVCYVRIGPESLSLISHHCLFVVLIFYVDFPVYFMVLLQSYISQQLWVEFDQLCGCNITGINPITNLEQVFTGNDKFTEFLHVSLKVRVVSKLACQKFSRDFNLFQKYVCTFYTEIFITASLGLSKNIKTLGKTRFLIFTPKIRAQEKN